MLKIVPWSLANPLSAGTYKWRVLGKKWPNLTPWTELQTFLLIY